MDARKVLEMGGGTYLVSLPKSWAKRNGVTKGDTLAVEELTPSKLVVRRIDSADPESKRYRIDFSGDGVRQVVSDITGAYLLGYDQIDIIGRRVIGRDERAAVKNTIARLVGLEVMEEDSKHIGVQFLLEPTAVDPERLVRRMSGILDGMMREAAEGLQRRESKLLGLLPERDDELDRLFFLLVRTIRAATLNPEVAERYGLGPIDLLDYRVLASYLESTGDALAELSVKAAEAEVDRSVGTGLAGCIRDLRAMQETSVKTFLGRRGSHSGGEYERIRELEQAVASRTAEVVQAAGQEGHKLLETLGILGRISNILVDISDLAATAQLSA